MIWNNAKYTGFKVGIIFTVCSFILTFTFITPIFSVLPGIIFETISSNLVSNEPYSNVRKLTILLLSIITFGYIIFSIFYIKKLIAVNQIITKEKIATLMFIFYLFVHPFGFYIYWGYVMDFRGDGQLIFASISSFPFSSLSFVFLGLLIDWTKNTSLKSFNKYFGND